MMGRLFLCDQVFLSVSGSDLPGIRSPEIELKNKGDFNRPQVGLMRYSGCIKSNEKIARQITISLLAVFKPTPPREVFIAGKDPADRDIAAGQVLRRNGRHKICTNGKSRILLNHRGRLRVDCQYRKGIGKHCMN
jgi:hypothetical protein